MDQGSQPYEAVDGDGVGDGHGNKSKNNKPTGTVRSTKPKHPFKKPVTNKSSLQETGVGPSANIPDRTNEVETKGTARPTKHQYPFKKPVATKPLPRETGTGLLTSGFDCTSEVETEGTAQSAKPKHPFKKPVATKPSPQETSVGPSTDNPDLTDEVKTSVQPRITLKVSGPRKKSGTAASYQGQSRNASITGSSNNNFNMSSPGPARGSSPVPPTMEPLSPVLRPVIADGTSTFAQQPDNSFTHATQATQSFIKQPRPQPIDFATNPDAIAMQATIAALLLQRKKAEENMIKLVELHNRAKADPKGFAEALKNGEIKTEKPYGTGIFDPTAASDDDEEDQEEDGSNGGGMGKSKKKAKPTDGKKPWPMIPARQNVVQVPSINWAKYGIMGESLDKLHEDQVKNPSEGRPAIIMPDGTIVPQEGGPRGQGGPIAKPLGLGEGVAKVKRGGIIKK